MRRGKSGGYKNEGRDLFSQALSNDNQNQKGKNTNTKKNNQQGNQGNYYQGDNYYHEQQPQQNYNNQNYPNEYNEEEQYYEEGEEEQQQRIDTYNKSYGGFSKYKNNPFHKDTHKNQQYKKREYNKKTPQTGVQGVFKDISEVETPQETTEFKRIQQKMLDIEIRQEDEENIDKINEMREVMRTADYSGHIKDLDKFTDKKDKIKDENALLGIIKHNALVMSNPDLIANIIEILSSSKQNEDITQDFIDLLGLDELDTISELIKNRDEIKELVSIAKSVIDDTEKSEKNMNTNFGMNKPNPNITIEIVDKKKKKTNDIQKTQMTNLKVLEQLGFTSKFIRENEMLGLKEKKLTTPLTVSAPSYKPGQIQHSNKPNDYKTTQNKYMHYTEVKVQPILGPRKPVERVRVESLPLWAQRAFQFKEFNEIQSTVFNKAFKSDENMLICAPTGAGKTNIALLTIMREISKFLNTNKNMFNVNTITDFSKITWNFKIVYLVPLKALANEIVDKFKTSLSFLNIKVNEFSADVNLSKEQIDQTQLFVAIPEKWDLFTRKNDGIFSELKLMIIDEVHLLNEDRGRVLECIVARTIRKMELNQKFIRIAGLSATLPNYWDVAEFLRVNEGLFFFDSSYRATPLSMKFLGVNERKSDQEYREYENEIAYQEVVKYLEKGKQVLVFVHSRAETANFAKDLIRRAQMSNQSDLFYGNFKKGKNPKFTNKTLDELIPYGIGFHNAGLMRKDRNSIESLFANKTINVLVSTSTLAWGVNLPAYAVIIKGVTFYDASQGALVDMGILDIQQMFGRAGRPQFDTKGVAMIVCPAKKLDYFVNLMKNQIEIDSKLPKFLSDALNAEIAIGNIHNLRDAISWLNLTYLGIRIMKNPFAYNYLLKEVKGMSRNDLLEQLVEESFGKLNKFKLIRYVKSIGSVHSTELGRVASKYYMSYQSIANFHEQLREDMYDDELLKLFASSEEFASMKVYPDEKKELETLAKNFDIISKNNIASDASDIPKPIILLQTYLKGYSDFKTSSLHMDCAYIIDNSSRIMRAILEIALHKHLVKTTYLALNYVRLVERRVYPGTTPLWQFTFEANKHRASKNSSGKSYENTDNYLASDLCTKIDIKNPCNNLEDLLKEDKLILSKILGTSVERVKDIFSYAECLPNFRMHIEAKPITRTILNITINLTPTFKWKKRWNHLSEPFWIIVDDHKEIIHHEYYIFTQKKTDQQSTKKEDKETVITFSVPFQIDAGAKEARVDKIYSINIISDRWVGVEFSHHIYLNEIEVPQDQDVHTELLDLFPLPKSALNNTEYEKIFPQFKYFNPIQTQVFYSCYNSDENILVGAPTGSGKTVVAELAILRVFRLKPFTKIIYIAPLKSLAKERIKDWSEKLSLLNKKVIELTGDYTPDVKQLLEADLLITTPEKWDGISRNWHHRLYVQRVALVIIDEIHLLGLERGPVLEVIVSRMRYIAEKTKSACRFVGLSTALANSYDVATWLGINTKYDNKKPPGLFNFKPAVRPCPVTVHIEGFAEKHYCPRMGTMNKPAFNAIRDFSDRKPVLIFVSSRRQTRLTALDLISLCANENSNSFLRIPTDEMKNIVELITDENLRHTLSFGIGMHHAGLVEGDRKIVEDLFYNSSIQILVATSTLAWGVNFPAHLVIIKGTEYFDPKLKTYVDMPITDVLQMIGRAGRPQFDDSAVACLFVSQDKKNFYKKFLYEPFPLESSLHKLLHDHINAEISSGLLNSKQACIDYITWTYFFRRLVKNPSYYGLKSVDAKTLNEFLNSLLEEVLRNLADSKCIAIQSDGSLSSTLLGYLCSFYYISYKTAYGFEMTLKAGLPINNLIEILSDAFEFSQIPVRHNEEDLNEALAKLCPFEVDHLHLDSPHIKTNLLIQAHCSRLPLPISDYVTDSKLVTDNCIRIILVMIDIAAEKGYLDTTINLVVLCQMIIQGLWSNDSSLLTIPNFTFEEVAKLKKEADINYLPELLENKEKIDEIFDFCNIKFNSMELKQIKTFFKKLPVVFMKYRCYSLNQNSLERIYDSKYLFNIEPITPGSDMQVSVHLEITNPEFDNIVMSQKVQKMKVIIILNQ
jgi:activating signal cointegrator complex subunit 3